MKGRVSFYMGAQLEFLGRVRTAQALYMEVESLLPRGHMELRLASWQMSAYRSPEEDER